MIHPPALAPDAVIRVQCACCLGLGSAPDPKLVQRFQMNPADWNACPACEGTRWLTEDEDAALPDYMRAEP